MLVVPFTNTHYNVPALTRAAKDLLNENITADLHPKELILMSKIFNHRKTDNEALANAENLLRHLHISFLVDTEFIVFHELAKKTSLKVDSEFYGSGDNEFGLVSGTIADWIDAILLFSKEESIPAVREFINAVLDIFMKTTLAPILTKYRRTFLENGTFAVEEK